MFSKKQAAGFFSAILVLTVILSTVLGSAVCAKASAFPDLTCETYVLMDAETGQIVAGSGVNKRMYPASITKIMTCLLACEEANYDEIVTMSEYATVTTVPRDSSHIALTTGQEVRMEDLIYGAFLASANDACNGIAEHMSGSIEAFAQKMTERARDVGAVNTNFANANGLFNEEHYTTAYDMALITREAIKNDRFLTVFGTVRYEIAPDNKRNVVFPVATGMDLLKPTNPLYYDGILGGKTGYVPEAGYTGVTVAERNGTTLIAVVMKSDSAEDRFADLTALLDYGFDNFTKQYIAADAFTATMVDVVENDEAVAYVTISVDTSAYYLLHKDLTAAAVKIENNVPETYSQYNITPALTLTLTDTSTNMYSNIGQIPLKYTVQQLENPQPLPGTEDDTEKPESEGFKIPVALKVIMIIFAVIFILVGIVIIMFLVSNAKRKRRDRMRRLRRQAMYEESRGDMIVQEPAGTGHRSSHSAKRR